jgi:hypothetical protein
MADTTRRSFAKLIGWYAGAAASSWGQDGDAPEVIFTRYGKGEVNKLNLLAEASLEVCREFGPYSDEHPDVSAGKHSGDMLRIPHAYVGQIINGKKGYNPRRDTALSYPLSRVPIGEEGSSRVKNSLEKIMEENDKGSYKMYWHAFKEAADVKGWLDLLKKAVEAMAFSTDGYEEAAFLCFGIDFAFEVYKSLNLYSIAKSIYRGINAESFVFTALEIDLGRSRKQLVNGGKDQGLWMAEAVVLQTHSTDDPHYLILKTETYTTNDVHLI